MNSTDNSTHFLRFIPTNAQCYRNFASCVSNFLSPALLLYVMSLKYCYFIRPPFPGHSTPMTKSLFLSHLRSRLDFGCYHSLILSLQCAGSGYYLTWACTIYDRLPFAFAPSEATRYALSMSGFS